jgi:hypothetical protein
LCGGDLPLIDAGGGVEIRIFGVGGIAAGFRCLQAKRPVEIGVHANHFRLRQADLRRGLFRQEQEDRSCSVGAADNRDLDLLSGLQIGYPHTGVQRKGIGGGKQAGRGELAAADHCRVALPAVLPERP